MAHCCHDTELILDEMMRDTGSPRQKAMDMTSPSIADMLTRTGLATELHLNTELEAFNPNITIILRDNDIHDTTAETGNKS